MTFNDRIKLVLGYFMLSYAALEIVVSLTYQFGSKSTDALFGWGWSYNEHAGGGASANGCLFVGMIAITGAMLVNNVGKNSK